MRTYTLVSPRGPPERTWCSYAAALTHIAIVEQMSRANSKANRALQQRPQEAEMSVRTEWTRVLQADPRMTSGDAILLVGQRRSIWPLVSEFKTVKAPYGKSNRKGAFFYTCIARVGRKEAPPLHVNFCFSRRKTLVWTRE